MLFVGVDPSARKIALVSWSDIHSVSYARAYPLYKKGTTRQTVESMAEAVRAVEDFIEWADQIAPRGTSTRYACVESPLVGRGGVVATMKQAYVGGIIRSHLHLAGFDVSDVNVSTWKKDVTGRGDSKKPDVKRCVKIAWPKVEGLIGEDGDLADAAGICLHLQRRVHRELLSPAPAPSSVRRKRPGDMVRPPRV